MLSLSEAISELANELPPGASLEKRKPPTRKAARKSVAPQSLYGVMAELRAELPKSRMSLEDARELRREFDVHEQAMEYITALFGKQNR